MISLLLLKVVHSARAISERVFPALVVLLLAVSAGHADGIIAKVTKAPIHPNGLVQNLRTGINIFLQTQQHKGDAFLDPAVIGYGLEAGGRMEVEMVSGFQRDTSVPLDGDSLILVAGTPQQGLPAGLIGLNIREGANQNTFVIEAQGGRALQSDMLLSPAPGSAFDPIRQRGIKIVHVGRTSAFVSRGNSGVIEVRFFNAENQVIAIGREEVAFLPEPRQEVFPTNIPHDQRNHNWQRVGTGQIVGVASNTLPLPAMLYDRNEGLENAGIVGAGVLSREQVETLGFSLPESLKRYTNGLILQDRDGDGLLNPISDIIIGGVRIDAPEGAQRYQAVTPLVSERPFLSVPTERYNERAGKNVGGAIMQVVLIAGDLPGIYKIHFELLQRAGEIESGPGSTFAYTVVVE